MEPKTKQTDKVSKTMYAGDWPGILNGAIPVIQKHVDQHGHGVFSFNQVLNGTKYERQAATIAKYLKGLGILVRGKRTETGQFNWELRPRKVTLRDVRRVRAVNSSAQAASPSRAKAAKSKTRKKGATKTAARSMSKPVAAPTLTVTKPSSEMQTKNGQSAKSSRKLLDVFAAVEALSKENHQLRNKVAELEAELAEYQTSAARIAALLSTSRA